MTKGIRWIPQRQEANHKALKTFDKRIAAKAVILVSNLVSKVENLKNSRTLL